ncbi:MAG: hypothetical protein KF712_12885 [Akkermansiaceae bacterium]|nr:hypothetical protein [Akkermansiaceae bacterium]
MKKPLLVFLSIIWLIPGMVSGQPEYPTSDDPQEFSRQAEEFFLQSLKLGRPFINTEGPQQPTPIKDDKRDWESVLARIIGDPAKYGFETSLIASNVTPFRGTSKDPRIVAARSLYWEARIREADERYEHYAAQGKPKYPLITSGLGSTIPWILRYGAPEHLFSVLDYFNSSADERNGLIFERATPREVADALRSYGDESHVEAAGKFAQKLRDVGRGDIADDIDRSIKRIRKDATGKQATSSGGTNGSSKASSASDGEVKGSANEKPLWPWLAAGGALIAALVAYFRMKRAKA